MNGRRTRYINETPTRRVTVLPEIIGTSLSSVVYKGHMGRPSDNKPVAIKTSSKDLTREKIILESLKEIDANEKGKKFLIHYYGTITYRQRIAFVFEYASVGSLCDWIVPGNNYYNIKACFIIAKNLANGLAFLHKEYFLHRDFNPANVLLQGDPRKPKAILSDFGQSVSVTNREQLKCGAILYRAPELCAPKNSHFSINGHTFATDVFSYGMILAAIILRDENPNHLTIDDADLIQKLENNPSEIKRMIMRREDGFRFGKLIPITFWCTEHRAKDRPDALDVANELDGNSEPSHKLLNYMSDIPNEKDIMDMLIERVHDFRFT